MQILDAEVYPAIETKQDKREVIRPAGRTIKLAVLIVVTVVLVLLATRAYSWLGQSQETKLLTIANPWNSVESTGYSTKLVSMSGGYQVDKSCAADLEQMLDDCNAAGNPVLVCSAYRTREQQQALFDNKVQRLIDEGCPAEEALELAAQVVAFPGTSEHELGLAVDIVDAGYQVLDEAQADTAAQQWLMENSWRYGFILRYPDGTTDITGIVYEPWHYRYVGKTAAEQINQLSLTLEEYVDMFYNEQAVIVYE